MVSCSQLTVGKSPPALGYPRCHVLFKVTPPSPLHLHPVQSVTPKSEFVCFVDYTAMSAYSVFNVRDKSGDIQAQGSCQKAHTSTKFIVARVMSTVDSYPGTRSLRRNPLPNAPPPPALARQSTWPSPVLSPNYPPPPLSTRRKARKAVVRTRLQHCSVTHSPKACGNAKLLPLRGRRR